MKKIIFIITMFAGMATAKAGLLFNYPQLALKDLDDMNKLVQSKVRESRESGGDQIIPLKEGVQAVFARPNDDFMIEKVIRPLKNILDENEAWESSVRELTKEAIGALKNPRPFQPVVQVTYAIFLENLMAEMKPRIGETFENSIIKQIRDAKIEITKEAKNERRIRMMRETPQPSEIAAKLLSDYEEKLEKEKAEAVKSGKKVEDKEKEESE